MLNRKTWLILIMMALAALWGCSDDDDDSDPTGPTETAFEVMAAAGKAYINDSGDCPGVINAQALFDNLADYTVIDIRREEDYLAGHIPGAYHSSFATILDDLASTIPSDKPYVVACYSGQSAGHIKIAMELLGYEDVQSLLFGMSSWNSTLAGSWNNNVDNLLTNPETTNNNDQLVEGDFPELSEDPATVVSDRVEWMLAEGFKAIRFSDVQDNLDAYHFVNYHALEDYLGQGSSGVPGHIPGAFQYTPYQSLGDDQMLNTLPTDKPVVVYCWTGQHSSQVTAYLNMLGYEAYSLSFGVNSLFHDQLTAHKWTEAATNDFALEVGTPPGQTFQTIADELLDYVNDSGDCPGVLNAQALNDNLADYTVIDIRRQEDYDAGHIPGAYHSSFATIMDDLVNTIPSDKPYVVACYSGQSAGHVKIAMEMMGYEDTYSLLFGMSSWNSTLAGSWNNNVDNLLGNPETTDNNGDLAFQGYPTIADGTTVADQVTAMLAAGFKSIRYSDIQDNLSEYHIVNYHALADYLGEGTSGVPGHIPGAYQYTPYQSLSYTQSLGTLPTDMPIVVYCWTGQHSSQVTAYLNMLGYEAYSLSFGVNSLFHDQLTAHKWTEAATNDFALEATTR
jgi:rhodanese-related sulfurtransferase